MAAGVASAQNLLSDGDFNAPIASAWTPWTFGGGYANQETLAPASSVAGIYDGTLQMSLGAASTSGGAGIFQVVSGTAGLTYNLAVAAGAQNWWLPTGQIRLFFLDANNNQLALTQINTTDGIHNPDQYDVGVAFRSWNVSATAPDGTTQVKVEFAGYGGGSTWFDNASLTTVTVPEPSTMAMLAVSGAILLGGWRKSFRRS